MSVMPSFSRTLKSSICCSWLRLPCLSGGKPAAEENCEKLGLTRPLLPPLLWPLVVAGLLLAAPHSPPPVLLNVYGEMKGGGGLNQSVMVFGCGSGRWPGACCCGGKVGTVKVAVVGRDCCGCCRGCCCWGGVWCGIALRGTSGEEAWGRFWAGIKGVATMEASIAGGPPASEGGFPGGVGLCCGGECTGGDIVVSLAGGVASSSRASWC